MKNEYLKFFSYLLGLLIYLRNDASALCPVIAIDSTVRIPINICCICSENSRNRWMISGNGTYFQTGGCGARNVKILKTPFFLEIVQP